MFYLYYETVRSLINFLRYYFAQEKGGTDYIAKTRGRVRHMGI